MTLKQIPTFYIISSLTVILFISLYLTSVWPPTTVTIVQRPSVLLTCSRTHLQVPRRHGGVQLCGPILSVLPHAQVTHCQFHHCNESFHLMLAHHNNMECTGVSARILSGGRMQWWRRRGGCWQEVDMVTFAHQDRLDIRHCHEYRNGKMSEKWMVSCLYSCIILWHHVMVSKLYSNY